ncbi:lipopolysaccharide cholinephosphotransferase [Mangrovibacterium marinum]|uniref:Lipopolysaccharide cholinephosphotransferase n=1 Tax=Mangrovibacterium marinum TaxID=1639118 RepID=A0A2T5C6B3_9BACT|nr:LicD family protein [Mangrovibacterium marinum]PTN10487.1 lipopolysaccharide cholinephosphotransferase [Mangrovibacterium marinum]
MKQISLDEIKTIELDILKAVHSICVENNLRYSLGGGTLLGAVRHKGFIPWDDDIDIMMPRADYERLISLFAQVNSTPELELQEFKTHPTLPYPYAKIINTKTQLSDQLIRTGIFIDIFPIDGFPKSDRLSKIKIKCATLLWSLRSFKIHGNAYFGKKSRYQFIWRFASALCPVTFIDKLYQTLIFLHRYEKSDYAGVIAGGVYGMKEKMEKSYFENTVSLTFEDASFHCISGYREYLSKHYGNYMELPPEDQRITHNLHAFYLKPDQSS